MKQRISIGKHHILLKQIVEVKIDNISYKKIDIINSNEKTSLVLQDFYKFINNNAKNINFLSFEDETYIYFMYIKNMQLHNYMGSAYWKNLKINKNIINIDHYFYIDGKEYDYPEWLDNKERLRRIREQKLLRLNHGTE